LYYTSAKQNKGIQELFLDLSKRLLDSNPVAKTSSTPSEPVQSSRRPGGIMVTEDDNSLQSERTSGGGGGGCCG
jgi:Ras-related protein Rab-21